MPGTLSENGVRLDPIEVQDSTLRVIREVTLQGAGLIVTHRIRTVAATAIEFRISDTLVAKFDIDDLGFHPDFEPMDGQIDSQTTVIEGVVEPGKEQTVISGLCLDQPKPPERIRSLHESVQPSIETSAVTDTDESVPTPTQRSSSRKEPPSSSVGAGLPAIFAKLRQRLWGGETGTIAEPEGTEGSIHPGSDEHESQRVGSEVVTNDGTMTIPNVGAETTSDGGRPAAAPKVNDDGADDPTHARSDETNRGPHSAERRDSASETESRSDDAREQAGPEPWSDLEFESETLAAADEEYRTFAEIFRDIEAVDAEGEGGGSIADADLDIVSRLLDSFEGEEWPAAKRRRLTRQLLGASDHEDNATSIEARLRALERETRALSGYTEALESVIDTHGTAAEYLGEVTAELDDLNAAGQRIQSRLGTAEVERESFNDRLSTIEERIANLGSTLDRLEDREASLRSSQELKFASLEAKEADLESVVDEINEMETQVQALQATLDQWERRRRALVHALDPDQ